MRPAERIRIIASLNAGKASRERTPPHDDLDERAEAEAELARIAPKPNPPRPVGRPRQDPNALRIPVSVSVHQDTFAFLIAEEQRTGESKGQVIDRVLQPGIYAMSEDTRRKAVARARKQLIQQGMRYASPQDLST